MEEIDRVFHALRKSGEKAFIPYLMAGYPDPDLFTDILKIVSQYGDIVEVGIPFSDPIADGQAIQEAGQVSLSMGMNLTGCLRLVERYKRHVPIVLMSYFNPLYRYGLARAAEDMKRAGVSGVIVPDLPPEEAREWMYEAKRNGIATIFLLAPTSNERRIIQVGNVSDGFIYFVSTTGITGGNLGDPEEIAKKVKSIKEVVGLPVVVGFGVATPLDAHEVASISDGIVVGSALIREIKKGMERGKIMEDVSLFLESIKKAVKESR